jgi:magnesium transporter
MPPSPSLSTRMAMVTYLMLVIAISVHTVRDRTQRPENAPKSVREATKTALRDLQTMEQDASFKAQKVQFLLDSTLGRINLVQNDIIKLFSVIAVIFMPPTVIASIYGMNFKEMPELNWRWGYPLAIMLMAFAAIGPYVFFRWKKWL